MTGPQTLLASLRLPAERLRWRCPEDEFPQAPAGPPVGQEAMVEGLEAAVLAPRPGVHGFIAGMPGSGRRSGARALLEGAALPAWPRRDLVLAPRALRSPEAGWLVLPPGEGKAVVAAWTGDPRLAPRLVSAAREGPPPVVELLLPSWERLLGGVAGEAREGGDPFAELRVGALLRADGGYLLLDADATAAEPGLWRELCRALGTGFLEPRPPPDARARGAPLVDPVPLNCTVLAFGQPALLNEVRARESGRAAFPVRVEARPDLPLGGDAIAAVFHAAGRIASQEGLRPLLPGAAAPLVERLVSQASGPGRLSARLGTLRESLREADAAARRRGASAIGPGDAREGIETLRRRSRARWDRLLDRIERGTLRLDVRGEKVGVVNALIVFGGEEETYGAPSRLTATAAVGREGVINLEREARLSGSTFDKGLLILVGLLRSRFAGTSPLSLAASLCLEQHYGRIDGDSAGLAEWIALVSELSSIPVRQDLAVTGSLNQKGEVQSVGRVEAKVEGFFAACARLGLTGSQGVLIPRANADGLMLSEDVVEACARGRFHVYAVDHVDEAVGIALGCPAGTRDSRGRYPRGTVNGAVAARLSRMASRLYPQKRAAKKPSTRPAAPTAPVPAAPKREPVQG